nr:MAG TPA: Helix-turn-helix XRE-family like protein [Caudoviricetes sp.]
MNFIDFIREIVYYYSDNDLNASLGEGDIMNNILINRIKKILTEQNMSKADLSRLTGISNSSLSEYLNGKYEPKQDKIALIAKALHVSPAWLMGFDEGPELNRRDEREIESDLEDMMNSVSSAAFEGEDDIEDIEAFKATIKAAMIQAKKMAKKKYTPKKYRRD